MRNNVCPHIRFTILHLKKYTLNGVFYFISVPDQCIGLFHCSFKQKGGDDKYNRKQKNKAHNEKNLTVYAIEYLEHFMRGIALHSI